MAPSSFALNLLLAQGIAASGALFVLASVAVAPAKGRSRVVLVVGAASLAGAACALWIIGGLDRLRDTVHVPYFQLVPLLLALVAFQLVGYAFMQRAVARRSVAEAAAEAVRP